MTALSEADKKAMIDATHEMACAMIDDLQHMREVVTKSEPTPGDIRRLSNPLRRILIDNGSDLRKVAAPRIGKIELLAPDILSLIRSGERTPYAFLSAGVADVFGLSIDAMMLENAPQARAVPDFVPGRTVLVRLDNFVAQRVISFKGQWVSRRDIIKYVANVAHGVHSGEPKEPKHDLIKRIRYAASIKLNGDVPAISFNPDVIVGAEERPLIADRMALDIVLIQLISTVRYLTLSPDVIRLEEIIQAE